MCCEYNRRAKIELLKKFGNRKTIRLWKVLTAGGKGELSKYQYGPGIHKLDSPLKRYRLYYPKGFHVYLTKPPNSSGTVISVVCHKYHLVRASCDSPRQAVFTQIMILKADWEKAFP